MTCPSSHDWSAGDPGLEAGLLPFTSSWDMELWGGVDTVELGGGDGVACKGASLSLFNCLLLLPMESRGRYPTQARHSSGGPWFLVRGFD